MTQMATVQAKLPFFLCQCFLETTFPGEGRLGLHRSLSLGAGLSPTDGLVLILALQVPYKASTWARHLEFLSEVRILTYVQCHEIGSYWEPLAGLELTM